MINLSIYRNGILIRPTVNPGEAQLTDNLVRNTGALNYEVVGGNEQSPGAVSAEVEQDEPHKRAGRQAERTLQLRRLLLPFVQF